MVEILEKYQSLYLWFPSTNDRFMFIKMSRKINFVLV